MENETTRITFLSNDYRGLKKSKTMYVPNNKIIDFCIRYDDDSKECAAVILDGAWCFKVGLANDYRTNDKGQVKPKTIAIHGEFEVHKARFDGRAGAAVLFSDKEVKQESNDEIPF